MELKGAEIRNLMELCNPMPKNGTENRKLNVLIPYYQRPYKWEETQIKNLFADYFKNEQKEYFVGSVVMVENHDGGFEIIDGQQRITTLFLLNYLKFIFLRAYIEELIIVKKVYKIDGYLSKLENTADNIFDEKIVDEIRKIHIEINDLLEKADEEKNEEQKEKLQDQVLKEYQITLGLPEKNLSDREKYLNQYRGKLSYYLAKNEFTLKYRRISYNEKMKEALQDCYIEISNAKNPKLVMKCKEDVDDPIVMQYKKSLIYEFEGLMENCRNEEEAPLNYTATLIETIEKMINMIRFCVVITGNEADAYTLFEVLNDRSLTIEDLDLTKNLLFKWYCNHTSEEENVKDKTIEKADQMWVEDIFSAMTRKEEAKLISFFAAEYFTADESQKFNDTARYRESIEKNYLQTRRSYEGVDLLNDIKIYYMIAITLKEMGFRYQKKAEKVIETETSGQKSITYRTLNLLNALKLYGVMPAIINFILKRYITLYEVGTTKEYDISRFTDYIKGLANDKENVMDEYKEIHDISYELWRYALLAKDSEIPRTIAKKYIVRNYVGNTDFEFKANIDVDLKGEFREWVYDWKYGSADAQLKAKVLFINLFENSKEHHLLRKLPARIQFNTKAVQLDHMEAEEPDTAAKEKYFEPCKPHETREMYVNSIGNFMIMDRDNNTKKTNFPLQDAMQVYDKMAPGHWMITEVKELLADDKFSKEVVIAGEPYRIPKEEFFNERKARLFSYFYALLQRGLHESESNIVD